MAGERQPPAVHALAHAMNTRWATSARRSRYIAPRVEPADRSASLRELVDGHGAAGSRLLLILGGNPVYNAPADLDFAKALAKVGLSVHLSLYEDETSALCHWHVPEAHSWRPGATPGPSTARRRSSSR